MDPQARPLAALALLCLLLTSAPAAEAAGLRGEAPASAAPSNRFTSAPAPAVRPDGSLDAAPMRLPSHPPGLAGGLLMRPASPVAGHAAHGPERKSADPVVAGFLGLLPLGSGFYVTSTPWKGLAFTLADAVLLGTIYNIRRDDRLPDGDVVPYFVLLAGVNAVDAALSAWQAHKDRDRAARVQVSLTPSGDPKVALAWTF